MNEYQAEEQARSRDLGLAVLRDPEYRQGYIEQLISGSRQYATQCHARKNEAKHRGDPVAAAFADQAAGLAEAKAAGLQQAIDEHEADDGQPVDMGSLTPAEAASIDRIVLEMRRSGHDQAFFTWLTRQAGIKATPGDMASKRRSARAYLAHAHSASVDNGPSGEVVRLARI